VDPVFIGYDRVAQAIVHGHGGIVIEHLKHLVLHFDLHPGQRYSSSRPPAG
jgi:acyl-coenzyme A synthetase/AMP-(fatty) acid ligase